MSAFAIEKTPLIMPQDKMWLSSDYILGAQTANPADGATVGAWANLDGRIMTCAQGSATSQPTFKVNIAGGRPGILFNGTDEGLVLTGISGFTAAQRFASTTAFTLIMTFKLNSLVSVGGLTLEAMRGAVATDKTTLAISTASQIYWEVNNAGVITQLSASFTDTTNPHIVVVTNDGASGLTMFLDGAQIAGSVSATSATNGTANSVWLGNTPTLNRPFDGYIFDAFYSSGVMGSSDRIKLTRFFANLRGISI